MLGQKRYLTGSWTQLPSAVGLLGENRPRRVIDVDVLSFSPGAQIVLEACLPLDFLCIPRCGRVMVCSCR